MSLLSIIRFESEVIPKIEIMLDMEREHLKNLESKKLQLNRKVNILFRFNIDKYINRSKFRIYELEIKLMLYKEYFMLLRESNKD